MILQKINAKTKDRYDLAYKYFAILSIVNNLNLVKRDLQLLAYSISEDKPVSDVKKEFVQEFKSSMPTVGNIISKLYKVNVLEKNKTLVTINKQLLNDFSKDLLLAITIKNGDKG